MQKPDLPSVPGPVLIACGVIWIGAVILGAAVLLRYEHAAGSSGVHPTRWPATTAIERAPDVPTLVMFAHPRCPCTRAGIGELAIIMTRCQGKLRASVLFAKPAGFPEGWERTDTWESAAAIPGVRVSVDPDGREARRFGAETSGQVFLYAADGELRFAGGITAARGHAGDNAGRDSVVGLLTGGAARPATSVFGCPLLAADECDGGQP